MPCVEGPTRLIPVAGSCVPSLGPVDTFGEAQENSALSEVGPWMPMYWADYLGDTTHLTTFQHGCYMLLIGAYWRRGGPIPDDPQYLAQVCRTSCDKLKRWGGPVLAMFSGKEGLLRHKRIDLEIVKSCSRIAQARAAASKRHMLPTATVTPTEESKKETYVQPLAAPPRKRSAVSVLNGHLEGFELWYSIYPLHKGRGQAERAFITALKTATLDELIEGARRYATEVNGTEKRYIAHPATWLNGRRWTDGVGDDLLSEPRRPKAPPRAEDNRPLEDD